MTDKKIKSAAIGLEAFDTRAAADKGAEIEMVHPVTKAPQGIFITVLGKDSEIFREHMKDGINERLRKEAVAANKGKDLPAPTAELAEEKSIELLVLCTVSWRQETKDGKDVVSKDTLSLEGSELDCTVANCKLVYTRFLSIRQQIDTAIGDLENFM